MPTATLTQKRLNLLAGAPGFEVGAGQNDGTTSTARFSTPYGIATDSGGNIYVADGNSHVIRKISSSGVVTTIAGSAGASGNADGTGANARFNMPTGIALDSSGNIFVADKSNHTIRKITSSGVVTTFAGTAGLSGSSDGTGSAARFNFPYAIVIDSSNNIFVVDTSNHTIRVITSSAVVTTLAGTAGSSGSSDGTGSAARFSSPMAAALDSNGNLYVADKGNNMIRYVTTGGVVTTYAGSVASGNSDGTGTAARFANPTGVALDSSGNVYVADRLNNIIRKIASGAVVTTLAGTAGITGYTDASGSAARFSSPWSIAIDGSNNIFVGDMSNYVIRKISTGGAVTTYAGAAGKSGTNDGTGASAQFYSPAGLAVDSSGNIYVADKFNHIIRKITSAGVVTTLAGGAGQTGSADGTGSAARFNNPSGLALDSSGNLFVSDTGNKTIRMVTPAGVVTTFAGTAGSSGSTDGTGSAARFSSLAGLAFDSAGNLFVADTGGNKVIRKITSGAVVTTFAGTAGSAGSADGTGSAARFNSPYGIAIDSGDNLYVADNGNNNIRFITSGAVVTTFAGLVGSSGSTDGTGASARFNMPLGVAIDASGNIYVAESTNCTVRKMTNLAVVTTWVGFAGACGWSDDTGNNARFASLNSIAFDSSGNAYVSDANNLIRKISTGAVVTTLAGSSNLVTGIKDGTGGAARFSSPARMVSDSSGNIYVADSANHTIRKITPAGVVTTFAGMALASGTADGTGSSARFNTPTGITIDSSGNLYVADKGNYALRKITPAGVVTTLAGTAGSSGTTDGTGSAARFNSITGAVADSSGNIYVTDWANHSIRMVTSGGVVTTLAGLSGTSGSTDGTGTAARFYFPSDITIDGSGNLYVTDQYNHSIRKIDTSSGVVTTFAGTLLSPGTADGTGSSARFNFPLSITSDGRGNMFVADTYNHAIRMLTSAGVVTTISGNLQSPQISLGAMPGNLFQPAGVTVNSGKLFISTKNSIVWLPIP